MNFPEENRNTEGPAIATQPSAAPLTSEDLTRAKNPNPRANENIESSPIETGSTTEVGSEITDGEAG